jgi:hypothetical protein
MDEKSVPFYFINRFNCMGDHMKTWNRMKRKFLTIFGDLKVSIYPMWISYCPTTFRVKGTDTEEIMGILKDGDIMLRNYKSYLDSFFIPVGKSGYTHSGIYFQGNVYHAIAEGVVVESVIDFCRADSIGILRLKNPDWTIIGAAHMYAEKHVGVGYDFAFDSGNDKQLYCHEFSKSCYGGLDIPMVRVKNRLGMTGPLAYYADSFYQSGLFDEVYRFKRKKKNSLPG